MVLISLLFAAAAAAPPQYLGPVEAEGRLLTLPDGSWRSYSVRNESDTSLLTVRASNDAGRTWARAEKLTALPGAGWGGLLVIRDRQGELQFVITRVRGDGKRLAIDRFIDLWHLHTTGGQSSFSAPQRIFEGYVGSIQQLIQLRSGRLLMPFAAWIGGRASGPPTGSNETTAVYSDDDGATWRQSPSRLVAPVHAGFNGSNYGAVEPAVLEREDGTVWMLMRTQTGFFYESTSRDGAEWSPAKASNIHSSTGPPFLLRLPDRRVVLFWNHCEMPPRVEGQGVYGGRDALHAAISSDEGKTWRGFREVYRDPFRNEAPPKLGDRGTAYPYATNMKDGKIALVSGQGAKRRALVIVDPQWLIETHATTDLSDWHVFLGVGQASGYWRDRKPGARIVDNALEITTRPGLPPDTAVWNFPLGRSGTVTMQVRGQGGELALTQRMFEPGDTQGEQRAVFRTPLPDLKDSAWHQLKLQWDAANGSARLYLDGKQISSLKANQAGDTAASYLRLKSTGGTFYVKDVSADVQP